MLLKQRVFILILSTFIIFIQPCRADSIIERYPSLQKEMDTYEKPELIDFIIILLKEKRYAEAKLFSDVILIVTEDILKKDGEMANLAPAHGNFGLYFFMYGQYVDALSYFEKAFSLYVNASDVDKEQEVVHLNLYLRTLLILGRYSHTEDVARELLPVAFEIYPVDIITPDLLNSTAAYYFCYGPRAAIFFSKLTLAAAEEETENAAFEFDGSEHKKVLFEKLPEMLKEIGREDELEMLRQFSISSAPVYPLSSARPLMRGPEVALYDRFIVVANALNKAGKSGDAKAIEKARAAFVVWMQSVPSALN